MTNRGAWCDDIQFSRTGMASFAPVGGSRSSGPLVTRSLVRGLLNVEHKRLYQHVDSCHQWCDAEQCTGSRGGANSEGVNDIEHAPTESPDDKKDSLSLIHI